MKRHFLRLLILGAALWGGAAQAADITVMSSGGYTEALREIAPIFEKSSGNHVNIVLGPSMGTDPTAIPARLKRGENGDVVLMVGYAIKDLADKGVVMPASVVPLGVANVGMSVRHGQPKPDISTVAGLKKTLLAAKSIAYSDSASGVYVGGELYQKLGLTDQLKARSHKIVATPVAKIVADGGAEIGFQMVSELLPVKGADFVGKLPESVQKPTLFSGGIPAAARNKAGAGQFLSYLKSPGAMAIMLKTGLEAPR